MTEIHAFKTEHTTVDYKESTDNCDFRTFGQGIRNPISPGLLHISVVRKSKLSKINLLVQCAKTCASIKKQVSLTYPKTGIRILELSALLNKKN